MDVPPSPKRGLSWARLKPLLAEAAPKAIGRVIKDIVVGLGTAGLALYFGTQANSAAIKLASIPLGCLAIFLVEFFPVVWRRDRPVILLLPRGLAKLVFVGLFFRLAWSAWSEHGKIAQLKDAAKVEEAQYHKGIESEIAQREDIAKAARRLVQLWKGKERFESAVADADKGWTEVRGQFMEILTHPELPEVLPPGRWGGEVQHFQRRCWFPIDRVAADLFGQTAGHTTIHTAHFDPAKKVDGEESIPTEQNRQKWRQTVDMHQALMEYIASTRDRINTEIDQLTKKVTAAAQ
jgi:hypothetical protein